jgi:hypothetical protein
VELLACGGGHGGPGPGAEEALEHMAIKRDGCIERRRRISPDEVLPLGFSAQELFNLPDGTKQAPLTWPEGEQTTIRYTLGPGTLFFVKSEDDPAFDQDACLACRDHVLIKGPVRIWTDDGQLDQRWPAAQIHSFLGRAELTLTRDRRAIRGKYPADPSPSECLVGLRFEILFTSAGTSGWITRSVANAACGSMGPATVVLPMPGGRWAEVPELRERRQRQ